MDTKTNETLINDLRIVLDDAEQLLRQAAASGGAQAEELRQRAAEAVQRATDRMRDMQHRASERTRAAAHATDSWVHAHPWTGIGAGLGVGFLVGLLVGRR